MDEVCTRKSSRKSLGDASKKQESNIGVGSMEDDDDDVPQWYLDTFAPKPPEEKPPPPEKVCRKKSRLSQKRAQKSQLLQSKSKPKKAPSITGEDDCEKDEEAWTCAGVPQDVEEALFLNQRCDTATKINLELYLKCPKSTNNEDKKALKGETTWEDILKDPVKRWICRPPEEVKRPAAVVESIMSKITRKCQEAMCLLMIKMGLDQIPQPREKRCDPEFQWGIDVTPTRSKCYIGPWSSTTLDTSKSLASATSDYQASILFQELQTLLLANEMGDEEWDPCACGNIDIDIEKFLNDPNTEFILMSVGAIDQDGNPLCSYKDYFDVEHAIKNLLVELAKEAIRDYLRKKLADEELIRNAQKYETEKMEHNFEKRMKAKAILLKAAGEDSGYHKRRKTKIYYGPLPTDDEGKKWSFQDENVAGDVAGRIHTAMDRKSLLPGFDSLIEILPFNYQEIFDSDLSVHAVHTVTTKIKNLPKIEEEEEEKEGLLLEFPMKAEYTNYKFGKDPEPPTGSSEWDFRRPKSWQEWENLKLLNELSRRCKLRGKKRLKFLMLKYSRRWLWIWRKRKAIRNYFCGEQEDPDPPSLWKGPYPPQVIKQIRALKGLSDFGRDVVPTVDQPESITMFNQGVRILDGNFFDFALGLSDNYVCPSPPPVEVEFFGEGEWDGEDSYRNIGYYIPQLQLDEFGGEWYEEIKGRDSPKTPSLNNLFHMDYIEDEETETESTDEEEDDEEEETINELEQQVEMEEEPHPYPQDEYEDDEEEETTEAPGIDPSLV